MQSADLRYQTFRQTRLQRFFDRVNRAPEYLAGLATAAMVISVLIQIVSRLIGRPVAWTEEGTRFVFIWVIFLGIAAGFRRGESARVTYFLEKMPRFMRRAAPYIYALTTIGFFLLMVVTGTDLVMQQIRTHEMGSALMIPMWLIGLSVPVSGVLGVLGVIESLLLHLDRIRVRGD